MYNYSKLFNIFYLYIYFFVKKNIMIYNNNIFHKKYYILQSHINKNSKFISIKLKINYMNNTTFS